MVDDGLTLYLREMGQHPVLSKAEELLLFKQLAAGDGRAREKIILSNLRLVVHIAKSYDRNGWLDLSDIIQEGNVGLIKAVDKFDHTKGHRFSTYAAFWIRREIVKAFENKFRAIRLPSHIHQKIQELKSILDAAETEPTNAALAIQMDLTEKQVTEIKNIALPVLSLNRLTEEDERIDYIGLISDTSITDPEAEVIRV